MNHRQVKKMVRRRAPTPKQRLIIVHAERALSRRDGHVSVPLYLLARSIEARWAFARLGRIVRRAAA